MWLAGALLVISATALGVLAHRRGVALRRAEAAAADQARRHAADLASRASSEAALRRSEAEFRAMAETSPAGIVMFTTAGDVRYLNEAALRLLGLPFESAIGSRWLAACHPDDRDRVRQAVADAVDARRPFTDAGRFLHVDGRVFWWRLRSAPIWSGRDCTGHVAVLIDETEQRAAEDALRESEERFRQLAEHIPAVVYLVEPSTGSMLFISPAYERIWGRTRASLYRNPYSFLDAVHEADRARVTAAYKERLTRLDIEYRITRPDGETVWIEDLQFPIRRADGGIYLVAGLAFDVTRRHRLEAQLLESQKMESLGRLAGGVAHDFNNLLTVILSYADLLRDTAVELPVHPASEELAQGLAEIESAGQRASSLTRQLLTFARRQVVDPRLTDLNELVEAAVPLVRHLAGPSVTVQVETRATQAVARVDPTQVEQVLLNLASNARDAMPAGGQLRLCTETVRGPVAGTDVPAGLFVAVSVADAGVGIPPEIRGQVFDPFFSTKPKGQGTGLGLSTAFGVVTQFGGYMHLQSQVGQGTTVTCYFPVVAAGTGAHAAAPVGSGATRGTELVLVVEDEPMVRDVARATLERQGYDVRTANNGVEGLQTAQHLGDRLAIVVTDVVMPQMGGWEMAERLRRDRPDVKILFTSGYNEEIVNAGGRVDETLDFLPKPYLPSVLSQRVRQVLDRGSS